MLGEHQIFVARHDLCQGPADCRIAEVLENLPDDGDVTFGQRLLDDIHHLEVNVEGLVGRAVEGDELGHGVTRGIAPAGGAELRANLEIAAAQIDGIGLAQRLQKIADGLHIVPDHRAVARAGAWIKRRRGIVAPGSVAVDFAKHLAGWILALLLRHQAARNVEATGDVTRGPLIEGEIAIDAAVVDILGDTGLAGTVGEDHVFVPVGVVDVGELADDIAADEVGAMHHRHLEQAAHPAVQNPEILVAVLVVAPRIDLGMVVRVGIVCGHRTQQRGHDRQVHIDEFRQRAGTYEIIDVADEVEVAVMFQRLRQAGVADVAQHLEARGIPLVHAEFMDGLLHVVSVELDGCIVLADAPHPVAQDGLGVVAVVVGANVEND